MLMILPQTRSEVGVRSCIYSKSQANREQVYKEDKNYTIIIKPSPGEEIPNIFK